MDNVQTQTFKLIYQEWFSSKTAKLSNKLNKDNLKAKLQRLSFSKQGYGDFLLQLQQKWVEIFDRRLRTAPWIFWYGYMTIE